MSIFFLHTPRTPLPVPGPHTPTAHFVFPCAVRTTALAGAQGASSVAGAEKTAATGTTGSADHRRPALRQHGRNSAVGSEEEPEHPAAGGGGGEEESQLRRRELALEEHRSAAKPGQEESTGREHGGGDRLPDSREHGGILRGPGGGDGERPAKPLRMHSPRPHTMDAVVQNSLLGALLSYQVRCCPVQAQLCGRQAVTATIVPVRSSTACRSVDCRRFQSCRFVRSCRFVAARHTLHVFC